jgi:UDP-2,3-diacylglucosamine hydrolase
LGLTGARLIPEIHTVKIGDETAVLCHGDQLCTQDQQYQRARYWLRRPLVQWILKRLPRLMRIRTAERARRMSKAHQSNQQDSALDVTMDAVTQLMDRTQADVLIHGHTHQPAEHPMRDGKRRIVLGSWNDQGGVFLKTTPDAMTSIAFTL